MSPVRPTKLRGAAVALAVSALKNEAVRKQLAEAPAAVLGWARERWAERSPSDANEGRHEGPARGAGGIGRFGQRGLERRAERLSSAFTSAFGGPLESTRPEVADALDEIKRSLTVAAALPLINRKRMHLRIDRALDSLEVGLMDAVMPKSPR